MTHTYMGVSTTWAKKKDREDGTSYRSMHIRYLKGTMGGFFYSPQKKKVFVSTNATFLEIDNIDKL